MPEAENHALPAATNDIWRTWLMTGARRAPVDPRRMRGANKGLKKILIEGMTPAADQPHRWKDFSGAMVRHAVAINVELPGHAVGPDAFADRSVRGSGRQGSRAAGDSAAGPELAGAGAAAAGQGRAAATADQSRAAALAGAARVDHDAAYGRHPMVLRRHQACQHGVVAHGGLRDLAPVRGGRVDEEGGG